MKRYLLAATIGLSVLACESYSLDEYVCIDACYDWNDSCGYNEEESEFFCEQACVKDEGGDPDDCEECFQCIEANNPIYFHQGTWAEYTLEFCRDEPGFSYFSGQGIPCELECTRCTN